MRLQQRYGRYDAALFEPTAPKARKIRCRTCRMTGYPQLQYRYASTEDWLDDPTWWGLAHGTHPWDCSGCERAFTTAQGLSAHRRKAHP